MEDRARGHFPDPETIASLECAAVRLARMGAAVICEELSAKPQVEFKRTRPASPPLADPVSGTDRRVESLIREHLALRFPEHAVIGEEYSQSGRTDAGIVWVVDPIDGTANYINGLPLFGCSIGVLCRSQPIAGAIWCASTHALRPGVYHAREGGVLRFDGVPLERRQDPAWRGLAAEPGRAPVHSETWDTRVLGCATLEFAFVAAGLLRLAFIPRPAIWDAAAGLALLRGANCHAVVLRPSGPETLLYFGRAGDPLPTLARWSEPLLIGDAAALSRASASPKSHPPQEPAAHIGA